MALPFLVPEILEQGIPLCPPGCRAASRRGAAGTAAIPPVGGSGDPAVPTLVACGVCQRGAICRCCPFRVRWQGTVHPRETLRGDTLPRLCLPERHFPFWLLPEAWFRAAKETAGSCSLFRAQRAASAAEFPSLPGTKACPARAVPHPPACQPAVPPGWRAPSHRVTMSCACLTAPVADFSYLIRSLGVW